MNAGDLIQQRYELVEKLGRGGMAEVWQAKDVRLERTVALKVISPGLADQPEFLVRFLREAQSVARINHPNVVNILDFGDIEGNPFLVMEFVPGESLAEMVGDPMDQDRAREIIAQAAAGAGAAHAQNIVHRDIKPANILVTDDGRIKLVDFGIASAMGSERLTVTGTTIGSPHYISPEQASGERATPASDVYALGIVLYEMLTARRPFEGNNVTAIAAAQVEQRPDPPSNHVTELDSGIEAIVMRCLEKDPGRRYENGTALADALRENAPARTAVMAATAGAVAGETAVMSAADFADDAEPGPPRDSVGKAILVGLGIGLVVLAIFIGVMLLVRDDGEDAAEERSGRTGEGPGPAETTTEPLDPETEVEEAPPTEDGGSPEDGQPPEDNGSPGEGEENDTGEDPPNDEEDPSDEATTETDVEPGGGGGGGAFP
jgi:eukaryotic-like serine/threonine-protein kinase